MGTPVAIGGDLAGAEEVAASKEQGRGTYALLNVLTTFREHVPVAERPVGCSR